MKNGSIARVIAVAALASLAGCGAGDGRDAAAARVRRPDAEVRWRRAWVAGGTEADTTLLQPWRLAVGRDLLYVVDKAGFRVAAFRIADGTVAWMRGSRGSGPGEFVLPTAIAVDGAGDVWVADAKNSRITVFAPDGTLRNELPLPGFRYVESMCAHPDGGMTVATSADTDPIVRLSRSGAIVGRAALPWADLSGAPPLSVQKILAPAADGCVLALALGRGFATLSGQAARTHPYIESFPLPRVEETVEDRGATVTSMVVDMRIAATSVAAERGEIAISPGGQGEHEHRLVDFYRQSDGAYLRTYVTPVPFQQMARSKTCSSS